VRVGFLSAKNYHSRRTFSGILHAMRGALAARPEVSIVDLGPPPPATGLASKITKKLGLGPQPFDLAQTSERERYAEYVQEILEDTPADVIFAPVASIELSAVRADLPVVYASDATFRLLNKGYDLKLSVAQTRFREGCEQSAIHRATRVVYPSRWAADSATSHYGAEPSKIDVIPFGACLEQVPSLESLQERSLPSREALRLLFVGKDFKRKGGALAAAATKALRERGVHAELTMVGCVPPRAHPGVTAIEYLDKDDPAQAARLRQLYLQAHVFLFPTRADCSPISLCEAAAFGLPSVATDVGGIADILQDDAGLLVPAGADGPSFADRIEELIDDPALYAVLTRATRQAFDARLNWGAWASRAEASLRQAMG
jgi:glycosyltransferase involved in cell wall biosynthesis